MTNANMLSANGPRPMSAVMAQQMTVAHIRNGIRRRARSVMAPSNGEMQNMMPIETALIRPTRLSARSEPTMKRTNSAKFSDVTPIEKMTLARS